MLKTAKTYDNKNLSNEIEILKKFKSIKFNKTPKIYYLSEDIIVTSKYDCDLETLKNQQESKRFDLLSTLILGIHMLDCIKSLHNFGYIHNDIKPSNFVVKKGSIIKLIDFGISQEIKDIAKLPKNYKSELYIGTRNFMSINAHKRKRLSKRDDLWSLFFTLLYFNTGDLPWMRMKCFTNNKIVYNYKKSYIKDSSLRYYDIHDCFIKMKRYIKSLKFNDEPNYNKLFIIMYETYDELLKLESKDYKTVIKPKKIEKLLD